MGQVNLVLPKGGLRLGEINSPLEVFLEKDKIKENKFKIYIDGNQYSPNRIDLSNLKKFSKKVCQLRLIIESIDYDSTYLIPINLSDHSIVNYKEKKGKDGRIKFSWRWFVPIIGISYPGMGTNGFNGVDGKEYLMRISKDFTYNIETFKAVISSIDGKIEDCYFFNKESNLQFNFLGGDGGKGGDGANGRDGSDADKTLEAICGSRSGNGGNGGDGGAGPSLKVILEDIELDDISNISWVSLGGKYGFYGQGGVSLGGRLWNDLGSFSEDIRKDCSILNGKNGQLGANGQPGVIDTVFEYKHGQNEFFLNRKNDENVYILRNRKYSVELASDSNYILTKIEWMDLRNYKLKYLKVSNKSMQNRMDWVISVKILFETESSFGYRARIIGENLESTGEMMKINPSELPTFLHSKLLELLSQASFYDR